MLLFFLGCKDGVSYFNGKGQIISVSTSTLSTLKYDSLYRESKLIPLETLENSLIKDISKLYMTDSIILIFDNGSMNIMLFSIDGHFVRNIGEKGIGPNEYVVFNDIQFEKSKSLIYAHERYQNSIYVYDLDGRLINKSPRLPMPFNSFYKTDSGYWIYSCFKKNNPSGYNLMLYDDNFNEIKASYFPQKEFVNISNSSVFTTDNHDIPYFYYPSSNTIYQLENDEAIPFCTIDFGGKTMPYEKIREIDNFEDYDQMVADRKYLGDIDNLLIRNNMICFSFRESGFGINVKSFDCYYDCLSENVTIIGNPFIEGMKYPVVSRPVGASDGVLIYYIDLSVCTENSYSYLTDALSIPIAFDSNPLLVVLDTKGHIVF